MRCDVRACVLQRTTPDLAYVLSNTFLPPFFLSFPENVRALLCLSRTSSSRPLQVWATRFWASSPRLRKASTTRTSSTATRATSRTQSTPARCSGPRSFMTPSGRQAGNNRRDGTRGEARGTSVGWTVSQSVSQSGDMSQGGRQAGRDGTGRDAGPSDTQGASRQARRPGMKVNARPALSTLAGDTHLTAELNCTRRCDLPCAHARTTTNSPFPCPPLPNITQQRSRDGSVDDPARAAGVHGKLPPG